MVVTTHLQQRWKHSCAMGGANLAMMAAYSLSQGDRGMFILRGTSSRHEHHAMLHLVSFIVLDTSEGVEIPLSPELVTMLRDLYLTEVRSGLLQVNPDAFPSFFVARMHLFASHEKTPVNPAKRIAIDNALKIVVSDGCKCPTTWNRPLQAVEQACDECKSAKAMLLRLGFITRDEQSHRETRLMGDWWEETIHQGVDLLSSEPLDTDTILLDTYVGPETTIEMME